MGLAQSIQNKVLSRHGNANMRVGSASMQGYREEMEDAHATVLGMQGSNATTAFFGVFDGHGGEKAALYAAERLPAIVGEYENSSLFSEASEETDGSSQSGSVVGGPFAEAMLRFDAEFLATPHHAHGATAIWSLVQPVAASAASSASAPSSDSASASPNATQQQQFRVIVANVGDSRCLWIGGDGQCLFATTDHKPKDPIEHQRIVAAGGFVQQDRVDGELAVARAVGDSKFKQNKSKPASEQRVCVLPDVTRLTASVGQYLLLACDGIFDKLTNEQVAEAVAAEMSKPGADPAVAAAALVDLSLRAGSRDNMSAMIVQFQNASAAEAAEPYGQVEEEFIAGPFYQWCDNTKFRRCYERDAAKHGYSGRRLWDLAYQASVAELDRTIEQLQIRVEQNGDSQEDFERTCERMRSDLQTSYEVDLRRAA